MCQCDSLEDLKLMLSDTDFCQMLNNNARLTPDVIRARARDKWVAEFNYIRRQATGELATFMEFITYDYLIKSVSFVISSLIRGNDSQYLLDKCG